MNERVTSVETSRCFCALPGSWYKKVVCNDDILLLEVVQVASRFCGLMRKTKEMLLIINSSQFVFFFFLFPISKVTSQL